MKDDVELEPATKALLAQRGIKGIRDGSLSLPQLTTLAKKFAATVDSRDGRDSRECEVLAPAGYAWAVDGEPHHTILAVVYNDNPGAFRPSYNDLANRMNGGLVACEPDCDCRLGAPSEQ